MFAIEMKLLLVVFSFHLINSVYQESDSYNMDYGSHHIQKGQLSMGQSPDEVLYHQRITKPGQGHIVIGQMVCYPPEGVNDQVIITYYEIHDEELGTDGALAFLASGDIGQNHVCTYIKSQPGLGYDYTVKIMGHRVNRGMIGGALGVGGGYRQNVGGNSGSPGAYGGYGASVGGYGEPAGNYGRTAGGYGGNVGYGGTVNYAPNSGGYGMGSGYHENPTDGYGKVTGRFGSQGGYGSGNSYESGSSFGNGFNKGTGYEKRPYGSGYTEGKPWGGGNFNIPQGSLHDSGNLGTFQTQPYITPNTAYPSVNTFTGSNTDSNKLKPDYSPYSSTNPSTNKPSYGTTQFVDRGGLKTGPIH